mmetsp:Transcript_16007/g.18083  ORF Transcript_16007/g.18083 Transcript_16007/m.18083 type:complete len:342 (+) Transcript_16007:3-1028(+)
MRHLDPETLAFVIVKLCSEISNSTEDAETRFYVLKDIYSILAGSSSVRFQVFMSCLEYSIKTRQEDKWITELTVKESKAICKRMGVSKNDERNLYLIICDALNTLAQEGKPCSSEKNFLVAYLETYEAETPEVLSTVCEYAARAAVGAIKQPFSVQPKTNTSSSFAGREGGVTSVYHLLAVQYLKNSSSSLHKGAYALLEIFCVGELQKFIAFSKENPGIFQSLGLELDTCYENMKLLALATLASNNDMVSYAEVAKALEIEQHDVERWVVRGIESQLIDAKLDQLNERIVINRGSEALFTENDWVQLDSKLKGWANSVQAVLSTVRQAKIEHAKIAAKTR